MAKLYFTFGMTGSGKSTFAKKFCSENKIVRLTHDELMIIIYGNNPSQEKFKEYFDSITKLMEKLASDLLNSGADVFIDIAAFKKVQRDKWRNIADKCGVESILFKVEVPREVALKRTLDRTEREEDGTFFIDENGFNVINARIEPLEKYEKFVLVDGISGEVK